MRIDLTLLSDQELIDSLASLTREERLRETAVVRHLAEMDRRNLPERSGFRSLFFY